jgi:hypothetical protein
MRRVLLVLAALASALTASGCAKQIDSAKAERSIKAGLERQTNGRANIASVMCPDDVDVQKGKRFDCTVKGTNGQTATVTVAQTDDKGDVTYSGNLAPLDHR